MAKKVEPLAELTKDALIHLEAMKGELDASEKNMAAMEEIGLDVSVLREKIRWSRRAIDIILKTMT